MSITIYNSKGNIVGNFKRYIQCYLSKLPKGIYLIFISHSNGEKERHLITV